MVIKNIVEPQKFFQRVKECKGKVELATSEGDVLNLKSTLCQYLALTQMFEDPIEHFEFDLLLSDPNDLELLKDFIIKK